MSEENDDDHDDDVDVDVDGAVFAAEVCSFVGKDLIKQTEGGTDGHTQPTLRIACVEKYWQVCWHTLPGLRVIH